MTYYKKFMNQGPAYYGDLDEADGKLLDFEKDAEEEGAAYSRFVKLFTQNLFFFFDPSGFLEWEEAYSNLRGALGLPTDITIPKIPRPNTVSSAPSSSSLPSITHAKRKASDEDGDVEMPSVNENETDSKRTKTQPGTAASTIVSDPKSDLALQHAHAAAAYITFLDPDHLLPPKMPTRDEMEGILLELRKKALVEEYFGDVES